MAKVCASRALGGGGWRPMLINRTRMFERTARRTRMSAASKPRIPNDFGQRSAAIIARISAPDHYWQSGKAV